MKSKGFTLIELLAVIVILAIIAIIATPIVLNIISDTKESARERTLDNIVHAAELAYARAQSSGTSNDILTFDLSDKDSGLEYSGEQLDGQLNIYSDGKIFFKVKFNDGTIYIKYPNNDSFLQYDNIVRADGYLWNADTNKADKLASYGDEDLAHRSSEFYAVSCRYAYVDVTGGSYDDIAGYEEYMGFNEVRFSELDNELNIISEIFDVEKPISKEEAKAIIEENKDRIPYAKDVFDRYFSLNEQYIEVEQTKIYKYINENLKGHYYIIIPEYIWLDLEEPPVKVTEIAADAFHTLGFNLPTNVDSINGLVINGINIIAPKDIKVTEAIGPK